MNSRPVRHDTKTPDHPVRRIMFSCDPVGIRTQDPQLRRLLLYPAELPDRPLDAVSIKGAGLDGLCRRTAEDAVIWTTSGCKDKTYYRNGKNNLDSATRAESTSKCNTGQNYNKSLKNSSFGVEKFNFSLGLRLIFSCTEWMNSSPSSRKSVPLGMYWRMSLFMFSILPFCQEA